MLFRRDVLERIRTGGVTVAFRRWKRPTVKPGGRLRTAVGTLAIDGVHGVSDAEVSEADARSAGFDSPAELLRDLGQAGQLYCIRFRFLGPDGRAARQRQDDVSPAELEAVLRDLARLDRGRATQPWTAATLALIARRPGRPAGELAAERGLDKPRFKRRVRQLTDMGLTESLTVGYRLSPRGEHILAHLVCRGD